MRRRHSHRPARGGAGRAVRRPLRGRARLDRRLIRRQPCMCWLPPRTLDDPTRPLHS